MARRIIDFHTHVFPENIEEKAVNFLGEYYNITISCRGRFEELLESASQADVQKLVVHATATVQSQVKSVNNYIASVTNEQVIGFGTVHPDFPDILDELDRIEELGLKGIKLHPEFQQFDIDEPRMLRIYEMIGDRFPILMHMGDENVDSSSPKRLSNVLKQFPQLRVVGAHLGGYARWDEVKEYLIGKNLFLDTSSCLWRLPADEAVDIIRAHGADKVLFGTDYPITSHQEELNRFFQLDLTEDEQELILWKNACTFLNIK